MNELVISISGTELEEVKRKAEHGDFLDTLKSYSLDEVHICAPIPEPVQDLICLGINYEEHIQEVGAETKGYTVYFSKRVNEASGAFDKIPSYPGYVDSLDYEAELETSLIL